MKHCCPSLGLGNKLSISGVFPEDLEGSCAVEVQELF